MLSIFNNILDSIYCLGFIILLEIENIFVEVVYVSCFREFNVIVFIVLNFCEFLVLFVCFEFLEIKFLIVFI